MDIRTRLPENNEAAWLLYLSLDFMFGTKLKKRPTCFINDLSTINLAIDDAFSSSFIISKDKL